MKLLPILFFIVFLGSCVFDPGLPQIHVTIDETFISQIDSVFLLRDSQPIDLKQINSIRVNAPENKYEFYSYKGLVRIKLKLSDNREILSDSIIVTKSKTKVKIEKHGDKIIFKAN